MEIAPGGFGSGMTTTATFIALTAESKLFAGQLHLRCGLSPIQYLLHLIKAVTDFENKVPHDNIAIATSGFYLCSNLGTVLGVSIGSSIQRGILKLLLLQRLPSYKRTKVN